MHKISYIFFLRDYISRHFEVTAKKTRLQNKKVGCCGNVPWKFEGFKSFIYSHSGTERWNRVKIRPVEVEIIGLTEIVKKERYRSKTDGYPVVCYADAGWPNNVKYQINKTKL